MGAAAGKARGSAYGLYVTFYYTGGAVGGFVPGLIWNRGGWPAVAVFILIMLAITFAVVQLVWRRKATPKKVDHLDESLTAAQ